LSRSGLRLGMVTRMVFLVLLAVLCLVAAVYVVIFFIPIVGYLVWRDQDRIEELERRLAAIEKPASPKTDKA
jgi:hypothetical protein